MTDMPTQMGRFSDEAQAMLAEMNADVIDLPPRMVAMFPSANTAIIAAAVSAAGIKYAPARGEDDAKTAIRICNFAAAILNEIEARMPKPDRMAAARAAKAAKAEVAD